MAAPCPESEAGPLTWQLAARPGVGQALQVRGVQVDHGGAAGGAGAGGGVSGAGSGHESLLCHLTLSPPGADWSSPDAPPPPHRSLAGDTAPPD